VRIICLKHDKLFCREIDGKSNEINMLSTGLRFSHFGVLSASSGRTFKRTILFPEEPKSATNERQRNRERKRERERNEEGRLKKRSKVRIP